MEKKTIIELVQENALQAIIAESDKTPSQRLERLRQELWRRRFPRYSQTLKAFSAILKQAKLPPGIQIKETPFFERDIFTVQFQFRQQKEFDTALAILQDMRTHNLIKRLEDLT